jgi:organic radical activating enzyme
MAVAARQLDFVWLELTGRCQLRCTMCYAKSGPEGDHGTMTEDDWRRVIDQTAELGARSVVFIGGEPTLHPALPRLVHHALMRQLDAEVYTNLARAISPELWTTFELPGVTLATSYHSVDPETHEAITQGPVGSHRKTRANIVEAVRRGIPIRVGVVSGNQQDTDAVVSELNAIGVTNIAVDQLREVGRGGRDQEPGPDQLCGQCNSGRLAVLPSGDVLPCVFSRWLTLGNVHDVPLTIINGSAATEHVRGELAAAFAGRNLRSCDPTCNPNQNKKQPLMTNGEVGACSPECSPSTKSCSPDAYCDPDVNKRRTL